MLRQSQNKIEDGIGGPGGGELRDPRQAGAGITRRAQSAAQGPPEGGSWGTAQVTDQPLEARGVSLSGLVLRRSTLGQEGSQACSPPGPMSS